MPSFYKSPHDIKRENRPVTQILEIDMNEKEHFCGEGKKEIGVSKTIIAGEEAQTQIPMTMGRIAHY